MMSPRQKKFFVRSAILIASLMLLVLVWIWRASTFPWLETAGRTQKADFGFRQIKAREESEIIALEALKGRVYWIDEFVLHDGIGVAFGQGGNYAVIAPSPAGFPDWNLISKGNWDGNRSDFEFEQITASNSGPKS